MSEWKIFYGDGSTFSSAQGAPHEAPSELFVCAVGYDERGRRYIMHGWDFYYWDRDVDQWWGMNLPGLFARLRRGMVYAYKEGWTVCNSEWERIMIAAANDPEFPIK